MNATKKIFILSVMLAAAISGIMTFYHTIVLPPADVPIEPVHAYALESSIERISPNEDFNTNNDLYYDILDELELYKSEGFLTNKQIDDRLKVFVKEYALIFIKQSNELFNRSEWCESDHEEMLNVMRSLYELRFYYSGSSVLSVLGESDRENLRKVEDVINKYREAKRVVNTYNNFVTVEDARNKINEAEGYIVAPLNNCVSLREGLDNVKYNIGNSHYKKISRAVNDFCKIGYENMLWSEFCEMEEKVTDQLEEYASNCDMYGDARRSIQDLESRAQYYHNKAFEYHKINTHYSPYSWRKTTSDWDENYYAYESNNYNIHGSCAVMSFIVSNVESVEFYIRSYGENNFDYVLVGKDYIPNDSSYDYSLKGKASDHVYSAVRFNDLDPNSSYTIYVVYRKDSRDNENEDRGYVLIPKDLY